MENIKISALEVLQKEMCLGCLRPDHNSSFQSLSPEISKMFTSCTKLQILMDDYIPDRMCQNCHHHLLSTNKFINQCKQSHEKMSSYLLSRVKTEDNIISEDFKLEQDQLECRIKTEWLEVADESEIPNDFSLDLKKSDDPITIEVPPLIRFLPDLRKRSESQVPQHSHVAGEFNQENPQSVNIKKPPKTIKVKSKNTQNSRHLPPLNNVSEINIKTTRLNIDIARGQHSDSTDTADEETDTGDEEIVKNEDVKEPKLSCSKCNKRFHYLRDLGDHMKVHTEILDRTCDICGKILATKGGLSVHKTIHTNDKKFACDVCGLRFIYFSALKYHRTTHTGEKTYACEICGKKFRAMSGLKSHSSTHRTDTPHQCKVCKKWYKSKSTLYTHRQWCGKSKMHCCDTCGKLVSTQGELRVHVRSHTKEKPYPCPHCDKSFRTQSHRAAHVRTHTGDRPHKCTLCDKTFTVRRTMQIHMRIHTGELPYKCSVCGRRFRQAPALKTHMKVHNKEKVDSKHTILSEHHQKSP